MYAAIKKRIVLGVLFVAGVLLLVADRAEAGFAVELVFDRNPEAGSYNAYARFEPGVGPPPTQTEVRANFWAGSLPMSGDGRAYVVLTDLPLGPTVVFTVTAQKNGVESPRSNEIRLTYATVARYVDSDQDGLLDFEEDSDLDLVVDPGETDSRRADTDGDGLTDFVEIYDTHTDPLGTDSDGDGTVDGRDSCNDMDRDGFGSAAVSTASCRRDNCPFVYNPGQTDSDYDSLGEVCDPCTNVGDLQTFDSRSDGVTFRRIHEDTIPGNDTMAVRGEFELPPATGFDTLDPSTDGARIVVEAASGRIISDIKLPGGIKEAGVERGWKLDPRGNKFRYIDQSTNRIGGIVKLIAKDMSKRAPRHVRLAIKGRDGDYPVSPSDAPIRVGVILGNSDASKQGACGETGFAEDGCRLTTRRMLVCR